jgi:MarR family transcriptional regulator, temperature-dependent positive regulator of motility
METASLAGTMSLLTRLSRVVYRRATPELLGLKLKEWVALVHLRDCGTRATQQGLAHTLMLDANNCVILLNGLEQDGLIERTRDPEDRRRHIVAITPEGLHALAKAERQLEMLQDDVLGNLTESERDELRGLLAKALHDHAPAI